MLNEYTNEMKLSFPALSDNESLARVCVAAFAAQLNPTVSDLNDIKTAVSEAVTNSIIHGYENNKGEVNLYCMIKDREVTVIISDNGVGISDVEQAKEPLYTSKPEMERSGMGFTVMETFMDKVYIESKLGEGTKITLIKLI